ncbi:phage tail protein [Bordetella avium]|uniref:phage tail protein n=1 Tax=Bordetella avium TaxID=521 RepID=UPI000E67C2D4|nr:phage tail protein [Bordetella avium]AZY53020.1 phage tail protein [Bordetella avium]RIQ47600.1 phage tail protein [Bordetella avium]
MSVQSTHRVAGPYACNGLTKQFPFDFKVFSADEVVAILSDADGVESTLNLGTDYAVALNDNQNANPGGSLTTQQVYGAGYRVTLTSGVTNTQPQTLTNQGGFYPKVLEDAMDRNTIQVQQLAEQVARCVKVGISDVRKPEELLAAIFDSVRQSQENAAQAQGARDTITALWNLVQLAAQEGKERWDELLSIVRQDGGGAVAGTYPKVTVDARGWVTAGSALSQSDVPTLPIDKVQGLQAMLDGKAASSHSHEMAQVNGLQTALDGKAATHHTHDWSQITGTPDSLGVGQTWQSVSRAANTTYTNTTGKPIMVHVQSTGDRSVTVASITVQGQTLLSQSYNGRTASISAIVPHQAAYQVSGSPSMVVRELR